MKIDRILLIIISFIMIMTKGLYSFEMEYQKPSADIQNIMNRPYNPGVSVYLKAGIKVVKSREVFMPYDFMAEPVIRMGGLELYEKSRAKIRSSFFTEFTISDLEDKNQRKVTLPEHGIYGSESVSYDEKQMVIHQYLPEKIVLWAIDIQTGQARVLYDKGLTQANDDSAQWMPDNKHILLATIPDDKKGEYRNNEKDKGVLVYESKGLEAHNRTYPNVIKTTDDEKLFDHYGTIQPLIINVETGETKKIGNPGHYLYLQSSPDGKYLLFKDPIKPYSRKLYSYSFKAQWKLIHTETQEIISLSEQDSYENLKTGWVLQGIRWYIWHPLKDHTLLFTRALDDGNPELLQDFSDEVRALNAPFKGEGELFFKSKKRLSSFQVIDDERIFVRENIKKQKRSIAYILNLKSGVSTEIWNRNSDEIYNLVGDPITKISERGFSSILLKNNKIYLTEDGLTKDGRKPFIDEFDLQSGKKKRIIEIESKDYCNLLFTDSDMKKVLITKENRQTPANLFLVDLKSKKEIQLTHFKDNVPELTSLKKQIVHYQRKDGVKLTGTVFLPSDWDGKKRLPLIMTAYPEEFTDAETAAQSSQTNNRYSRPWGSSLSYFCLKGYAVLADASFPIIGDPQTVNDTWIDQANANAHAVIQHLYQLGIADTNKVVVQGHSYGAFMVVNLLAHSDLFAGGIARNGAYNRTLTPFGFQSERRTLWEAKDIYLKLSPFLYADKINKPLLLIHSMDDTNPGTFPFQSERLFEALEGNGKKCRYVKLPLEDHNYVMKETHQHLLWEYEQFLNNLFK